MPSCNNSASSQSTRVFAPHVVLKQDTSRLAIQIKTIDGLPASGITAGDIIRYDPLIPGYTLSVASSDEKAEVVGVVETATPTACTVVVSGSVLYPVERLNKIVSGGSSGKDILFLDDVIPGGLTGTVDTSATTKIVKPVLQLAPHGNYNGIVVNYIGYKTGNAVGVDFTSVPQSTIIWGPGGLASDAYIALDTDQYLTPTQSPSAYEYFGTSYGPWLEKIYLTVPGSSIALTQGLVTSKAQAYQLQNGVRVNAGIIEQVDTVNSIIWVRKGAGISSMSSSLSGVYINGYQYSLTSSSIAEFFIPKVEGSQFTQGGDALVPYFKTIETSNVFIPDGITCTNLNATSTLIVNSVNVGSKLTELENKINLLNNRVNAF